MLTVESAPAPAARADRGPKRASRIRRPGAKRAGDPLPDVATLERIVDRDRLGDLARPGARHDRGRILVGIVDIARVHELAHELAQTAHELVVTDHNAPL